MAEPPGGAHYEVRESTQTIDPDRQCGVPLISGNVIKRGVIKNPRCQNRLSCKFHSLAQKKNVLRSRPFEELDQNQPVRVVDDQTLQDDDADSGDALLDGSSSRAVSIIDPDVQCAVPNAIGLPCTRNLVCYNHNVAEKSKVEGRCALRLADHLRIFSLNRSRTASRAGKLDLDIHCHVTLSPGHYCRGKLSCPLHTLHEKSSVPRSGELMVLLELQIKLTLDTDLPHLEGFGLSSAAAPSDAELGEIHKRYRRDGMQTAMATVHQRGEANDIDFTICDPAGQSLENIRSALYHTFDTRLSHDLTDFLPSQKRLDLSEACSRSLIDDTSYHFAFTHRPFFEDVYMSLESMQDMMKNASLSDACMISVPKATWDLSGDQVAMLKRRLRVLLERLPFEMGLLSDKLKHQLLVTAMSMPLTHELDVPARVPFHLEQAEVDGKPVILLRTAQLPAVANLELRQTAIAIPLHAKAKDGAVALPSSLFAFHGLEPKSTWAGVAMTSEKQSHMRDIAMNIVSHVHLTHATRGHVRWALALLSKMHDVPLLFREHDSTDFMSVTRSDDFVAVLDENTGIINPSSWAQEVAPHLPSIQTTPSTNEGHLVMQCIQARFLHTKDLLLTWADGSNACDMHHRYDEVMHDRCQCSTEQSQREYHRCKACGALAVCIGLKMTQVNGLEVPLCSRCVVPHRSTTTHRSTTLTGSATARVPERTRVRTHIKNLLYREHKRVYPNREESSDARNSEYQTVLTALLTNYSESSDTGQWQWKDAYLDSPIVAEDGRLACSVEACHPLVWLNDVPREHVLGNMVLTKLYANLLAGSYGPIALQLLHKLDAASSPEEKADLILRIDHLYLIRSQILWSEAKRVTTDFDSAFQLKYAQQWQTGVADLAACEKIADLDSVSTPYLWRSKIQRNWINRVTTRLPGIQAVQCFLEDLESSTGGRFRRLGDNAPYPFVGGPDPANWSWGMFYGTLAASYEVLRMKCNFRGTTAFDLPRLACAVLYLLMHKGCPVASPLFDLPVSIYTRHLLSLSVGKGNHAKDMYAGLPSNLPIALINFRPDECNLCIEPWVANSARGNRDDEAEPIRKDFKHHFRQHNPPHWNQDLSHLDPEVTAKYITNVSQTAGAFDEEDTGAGNSGGNGSLWEQVPEKRNLMNLGETCYLSTLLQTLHNNRDFHGLVANERRFKFMVDTGTPDHVFLPHGEFARDLSETEILAYRQQKLINIRILIFKLQKLFGALDLGGAQLADRETSMVLACITALDSRWTNHSDESAELLNLLVEYLAMACDSSRAFSKGKSAQMSNAQEAQNKQGRILYDLQADSPAYWAAFRAEGHESSVTDAFFSQIVKEVGCADASCQVVSRGYEHLFVQYLDFPRHATEDDDFTLEMLLDNWKLERLGESNGHICEHVREHPPSLEAHRRFPHYICFALRRGHLAEGGVQYSHPLYLPEELDLGPYADESGLPSVREEHATEAPKLEYELVAVNNWKSGHYIGYTRNTIQGEDQWVVFNDMHAVPERKTPFEGHAEGEMIHYAVYKKQSIPEPEPELPAARIPLPGERGPSQDDVFGSARRDGAASGTPSLMVQSRSGEMRPPPPFRLPSGSHGRSPLGTGASPTGLGISSGTGPSPTGSLTGRFGNLTTGSGSPGRSRRMSEEEDLGNASPKSARGEHHSDVSSARLEQTHAAREADMSRRMAEMARRDAEITRREAAMTRSQNMLRRSQQSSTQLRSGDVVVREERLRDLNSASNRYRALNQALERISNGRQELGRRLQDIQRRRSELESHRSQAHRTNDNNISAAQGALRRTQDTLRNTPIYRTSLRLPLSREATGLQERINTLFTEQDRIDAPFQRPLEGLDREVQAVQAEGSDLLLGAPELEPPS